MKSPAFFIGTFQAVDGKPAFLSTCFFMNSQLPVRIPDRGIFFTDY